MSEKIFNISIAGCGKVAHLHAKAIGEITNARLSGVWSRTRKTADEFANRYNTKSYDTVDEMIRENGTDLVIVCTPHPFHKEPAVSAALSGSDILVEKPLASTLEDCDEMIRICVENKVRLGVISQRRWYDPVRRLKEAIDAGKIGRPVLASVVMLGWRDRDYYDSDAWRGTWDMEGGGVLVNQSPHHLDLLLWLMGEVDEVYGLWRNLNHPYIMVDDTAVAIARFKSGAIGTIIVSNSQKPGLYGKVHIHGDNGASVGVQTDGGSMFIAGMTGVTEPSVNDLWTIPGEEGHLAGWVREDTEFFSKIDPTVYFMKCQIEDFLHAVACNKDPLVTGTDGRRVVELFTAIYQSTYDNAPVKFPVHTSLKYDPRPLSGR
jgi:UDP-N-acetyl-2-amino-2-deoxyglucuronate dehydrogenase